MKKLIIFLFFLTLTAESLDSVTFTWEAIPIAGTIDHFEIKLIRDNSDIVYSYSTKEPKLTVKAPKPGLYRFSFRSCKDANCISAMSWCTSTDASCVDGGQPFQIKFNLTKPFIKIVK